MIESLMSFDDPRWGYAALAAVGGVMYQFFKHADQSARLSFALLLTNAAIAAFVGVAIGEAASGRVPGYASAIIALTGFFSFPILRKLEAVIPGIVERFGGKVGASKSDDDDDERPRSRRRPRRRPAPNWDTREADIDREAWADEELADRQAGPDGLRERVRLK